MAYKITLVCSFQYDLLKTLKRLGVHDLRMKRNVYNQKAKWLKDEGTIEHWCEVKE